MFFFACHSVLSCVGGMEHSDSRPCLHWCFQCQGANHNHVVLHVTDLCSGVETIPWNCSCSGCLYMAEAGTDFGKTPPGGYDFLGVIDFFGRTHFFRGV